MSENLSEVESAQLEQWAYGRAITSADLARAELAAAELQRRVAAERERAEREEADRAAAAAHALAVANGEVDESSREHPESPLTDTERRHRRRMLATGIAGVTAAALALTAGVVVLSQPNPDPLAIFERDETQLDRDWALRLESAGLAWHFTEGPRAIELDDGFVAVVARVSTVPDGRSTPWDSYCLVVGFDSVDDGGLSLSATCIYPEVFEREGIAFPQRPSASGIGHDTVRWGPVGGPRLETQVPSDQVRMASDPSVLYWMVFPTQSDAAFDPTSIVGDASDLLMGPGTVPISVRSVDAELFDDSELVTLVYLLRNDAGGVGTRLCIHVEAGDGAKAGSCAPLTDVRRDGIDVPITTNGHSWLVRIDADGQSRTDSVRLLD